MVTPFRRRSFQAGVRDICQRGTCLVPRDLGAPLDSSPVLVRFFDRGGHVVAAVRARVAHQILGDDGTVARFGCEFFETTRTASVLHEAMRALCAMPEADQPTLVPGGLLADKLPETQTDLVSLGTADTALLPLETEPTAVARPSPLLTRPDTSNQSSAPATAEPSAAPAAAEPSAAPSSSAAPDPDAYPADEDTSATRRRRITLRGVVAPPRRPTK